MRPAPHDVMKRRGRRRGRSPRARPAACAGGGCPRGRRGSGSRRAPSFRRASAARPNACTTSPPTVSNSSSAKSVPKCSLKSSISVCAFTRQRPLPSAMMLSSLSSKSYSSSMSPTICSSTSSIVTSPETPPYSSTTIAMWLRFGAELAQQHVEALRFGHEHRGAQRVAQVEARPGSRSSAAAPSRAGCRRCRPCSRRSPESASARSR